MIFLYQQWISISLVYTIIIKSVDFADKIIHYSFNIT